MGSYRYFIIEQKPVQVHDKYFGQKMHIKIDRDLRTSEMDKLIEEFGIIKNDSDSEDAFISFLSKKGIQAEYLQFAWVDGSNTEYEKTYNTEPDEVSKT